MPFTPFRRRDELGNILFLILLAVVLFAALSLAITNSFRNGNPDGISKEAANAAAADIDSWFGTLDLGVQRMMVVNNITENNLDVDDSNNFNFDGSLRSVANAACTTNACKIFNPAGGGVISRTFSKYGITAPIGGYLTYYVGMGNKEYLVANLPNVGTSANDVIVQVTSVKQEICRAYNRLQGLSECPSISYSGSFTPFWGTGNTAATNLSAGIPQSYSGTEINGKHSFCRCSGSGAAGSPLQGNIVHAFLIR